MYAICIIIMKKNVNIINGKVKCNKIGLKSAEAD